MVQITLYKFYWWYFSIIVFVLTIILMTESNSNRKIAIPEDFSKNITLKIDFEKLKIVQIKTIQELTKETRVITAKNQEELRRLIVNNLPRNDFSKLVDLEKFEFEIFVNQICDEKILLLILIHSAPKHFMKRNTIRKTWGEKNEDLRIVFLLGKNKEHQRGIEEESEIYKDIIQGNFVDSYRNMTYKHIMGLKFAVYFCQKTTYILKIDDDVYVNIRGVIRYLKNKKVCRNNIECHRKDNSSVARFGGPYAKWAVTFEEYKGKIYPPYCLGHAIFYTWDTVFNLYLHSPHESFFWIDDVHVTGTLAERAGIFLKDIQDYELTLEEIHELLRSNGKKGKKNFLVTEPISILPFMMRKIWTVLNNLKDGEMVYTNLVCEKRTL